MIDSDYEIGSSSEAIPFQDNIEITIPKTEAKNLTPEKILQILHNRFDFSSDSSDFQIYEEDTKISSQSETDLSCDENANTNLVTIKLRRVPRKILTPDNIPDLNKLIELSDSYSEESESSHDYSNTKGYESLQKALARAFSSDSGTYGSENSSDSSQNINNKSIDSIKRKVTLAHLAAFALAGYSTICKEKELESTAY
ncbi:hypothetical protein TRFO_36365 [Tritrichomonas foetus]|uniref:Uncharacterized protein n=1 Tax=Tritrichomonas foetus TaxID=1144522 RepID=A0A1J4JE27_9EUKA|nr:hypothetical protein TRFO_36365 [Tritrichomonas foetus]|eukprot:OHS97410.1 hypothetical protein TRFO_36365 [Tritrichomonas foetus]